MRQHPKTAATANRARRKAAPENRGSKGDPSGGRGNAGGTYRRPKPCHDERGRFTACGGAAHKAGEAKRAKARGEKARAKLPRKVGTAKQRKGLADQIRAARAKTAGDPSARAALVAEVRSLRQKRAEWQRGQGKPMVERLPKPPKPAKEPKSPATPAKAPRKAKANPTPPEPTPKASTHHEQMAARVDAEIGRLKGEFARAKADMERAEAAWKAVKDSPTPPPDYYDLKDRARATFVRASELSEQGKRFVAWKRDVQSNPHLIPPFEMSERLRIYTERGGAAKVEALAKLGAEPGGAASRLAELEASRTRLKSEILGHPTGSPAHQAALSELAKVNAERRTLTPGTGPDPAEVARAIRPTGKTLDVTQAPADTVHMKADPLEPGQQPAVDKGLEFIRSVTADAGIGGLEVPVGKVSGSSALDRSHCTADGIALEANVGPDVMVHEFGHYLEYHSPGAGAAALEFLKHRVGDETPRKMNEVRPGGRYKDNEYGRKDKFDAAFDEHQAYYIGKDYGRGGSEIMAMGLQKLHTDAANFARKDPEYASLVLGILDGSLR